MLKLAFNTKTTSVNDDLIGAANEINSRAPIVIDSMTRFDRVEALCGNIFQYNYTLTTLEFSQIDTNQLKANWRQSIVDEAKKDPKKMSIFKENGVVIQAKYHDKKGNHVTTISLNPTEY